MGHYVKLPEGSTQYKHVVNVVLGISKAFPTCEALALSKASSVVAALLCTGSAKFCGLTPGETTG